MQPSCTCGAVMVFIGIHWFLLCDCCLSLQAQPLSPDQGQIQMASPKEVKK